MIARHSLQTRLELLLACVFAMGALAVIEAQDSQTVQAGESANPGQAPQEGGANLSVSVVEASRSAIEQDSSLQDAVKQALISKYTEALTLLTQADANSALALSYGEAAQSAPRDEAEFARQLDDLPSAEEAANLDPTGSMEWPWPGMTTFSSPLLG